MKKHLLNKKLQEDLQDDVPNPTDDWESYYVDNTKDGYTLLQFGNDNFDFYQSNNDHPFVYKIYDSEGKEIKEFQTKTDALNMDLSAYLKSDIRKAFIKYVNIDRVEKEDAEGAETIDSPYSYYAQNIGKERSKKYNNYKDYKSPNNYIWGYNGFSGNDLFSSRYISEEEAFKKYNNSNTLCFHKTDPTTTMLKQIYNGKGWDVINNSNELSEDVLHKLIDAHERIVMLGHGTSQGLIGFINNCCAEHLKGKKLFMLWCNADGYWAHHKDLGRGWFCCGNMPSDSFEARAVGYNVTQEWMDENITYWCKLCGDVVEQCLEGNAKSGTKYIRDKYWEKYKDSKDPDQIGITIYNYQRTKTSGEEGLIPSPVVEVKEIEGEEEE